MDRAQVDAIANRWHPIAAPVSDANVALLLDRLEVRNGGRVLDLGCGLGRWLCGALERDPNSTGVGVDISAPALEQARAAADTLGLTDRVSWERSDALTWEGDPADAVFCIGAMHAFGGLHAMLDAARRNLRPGGRVLLGEGFWETPPTSQAIAATGDPSDWLLPIEELLAAARQHGFEPGFGHISSADEWDRYIWSWCGGLMAWAVNEAGAADREEAVELAHLRRRKWLEFFRGRMGFLTVVLHDRTW
jgi:SAM-dependent methyltransferase